MSLLSLHPKQFLALLSAVLSLVLLSSGVVTWVAANWQSISPNSKLISVQAILLLVGAILLSMRLRLSEGSVRTSPAAFWWYQGLAFLGAVVSGALLALVGQIYQSGADTWQLFALWFLLILPWLVFSPNIFISALAAVVANTAAALFLMNNQLLISPVLATYFLAFLNAVLFVVLEQKRARQDPLWAVLSTSILICAIVIFSLARAEVFVGAFALHLFVASGLLTVYNHVTRAPLRLKVLAVMVFASSVSAYLLETSMKSNQWMSEFVLTLALLGVVWLVATLLALQLWRLDTFSKTDTTTESVIHKVLPVSISVFLSLSIILVATFFYMSFLLSSIGVYLDSPLKDFGIVFLLLIAFIGLYYSRAAFISYAFLVLYQIVVLFNIENIYLHYGSIWSNTSSAEIPLAVQILTILGLLLSVLIYRRRSESWIRFISSLGFFIFLGGIRNLPYLSHFGQERFLFPLIFIALIWWFFRRSKEVHLALITAFVLWGIKVVTDSYGFYMSMYLGADGDFVFKDVLLAFLMPMQIFLSVNELSFSLLFVTYSLSWIVTIVATLLPLWALLQLVKNKGVASTVVAILMGLLVAWLWFARLEVLIPFTLMILAYYVRSRALYYLAAVLGLASLSQFYFSLFLPLNQKVYLLLLSGGLFLVLSLFSVRWLLNDEQEPSTDSSVSNPHLAQEPIKSRIIPSRRSSFMMILAGAVLLPILLAQWQVQSNERILSSGQPVLLRLVPVDPRSLMQGDYMIINYEVNDLVQVELEGLFAANSEHQGSSGQAFDSVGSEVIIPDSLKASLLGEDSVRFLVELQVIDGVAERVLAFHEADQAKSLDNNQEVVYLPYLVKDSSSSRRASPRFSTEYFFSEEAALDFEKAKFAEIVVDRGQVMLKALVNIDRRIIGQSR
ncbi:MAG: GDYXXLXY domain-containing protein [Alcaligenaceae bacterium]|nr:GDYXXLXY domain-containing protein [Alcaligenaceae bacterium]